MTETATIFESSVGPDNRLSSHEDSKHVETGVHMRVSASKKVLIVGAISLALGGLYWEFFQVRSQSAASDRELLRFVGLLYVGVGWGIFMAGCALLGVFRDPIMNREELATVELGAEEAEGFCECCGGSWHCVEGKLSRKYEPYGMYRAAWTDGHPEKGMSVMICLYVPTAGRPSTTMVLLGKEFESTGFAFTIQSGAESRWNLKPREYGHVLSRDEGLEHPSRETFVLIASQIVAEDPRAASALREFYGANFATC